MCILCWVVTVCLFVRRWDVLCLVCVVRWRVASLSLMKLMGVEHAGAAARRADWLCFGQQKSPPA